MTRIFIFALLVATPAALAADVYDSPNNDGISGGLVGVPTDGSAVILNLYIDGGPNESAGGDRCTGNGGGDELCGWDVRIGVNGDLSIDGFVPAPGVVASDSATSVRANGLDAINPTAGPRLIGTLTVSATGSGDLLLLGNISVGSDLLPAEIAQGIMASTNIDSDGDGLADVNDNCTLVPNADQRDTNGDGFGNLCDADLNNDLVINVIDLGILRTVFFAADEDADFNGDGIVNALDLGRLKNQFFGPPGPSGVAF